MTLTELRPRPTAASRSTEALIREARRRQRRRWALIAALVVAVAGTGVAIAAGSGDGSHDDPEPVRPHNATPPATPELEALPHLDGLRYPSTLAVDNDGNLLIADQGTYQIKRRLRDGSLQLVAGTGTPGSAGDGRPAAEAEIGWVAGMAVTADDSVYITDFLNDSARSRLRAVRPDGTITTISDVIGGRGITIAPDESLYVAGIGGVHRITPDGVVTNVISISDRYLHSPNGPTYAMSTPTAVAFDGSGNMYVSNHSPPMIVEFSPSGEALATWDGRADRLISTRDGVLVTGGRLTIDRISNGVRTTLFDLGRPLVPGVRAIRVSGLAAGLRGELYADQSGIPGNGWSEVPVLLMIDADDQLRVLGTRSE